MNPLIRIIPPPLVRFFAKPYVAGDSLEKAMDVAAGRWEKRRLMTTLDLLAEGIDSQEMVEQNVQTYFRMVDAAATDARFPEDARPTVSLKLSSYTTDPLESGGKAEGSREAAFRIAERAREKGVGVTVDMESRHWTDFTLDLLRDLHQAGHDHVGAVLQTRLHRTEQDIDRLPEGIRVRLVIGIYKEPSEVALTNKPEMKERMVRYADRLLERGHYVEFGTHDDRYIQQLLSEVIQPKAIGPDRFELQMLYGVPRVKLLRNMVKQGYRCRLYVPFAIGWSMAIAYLRRRLDEYPAMAFLVLKNFFTRG